MEIGEPEQATGELTYLTQEELLSIVCEKTGTCVDFECGSYRFITTFCVFMDFT